MRLLAAFFIGALWGAMFASLVVAAYMVVIRWSA